MSPLTACGDDNIRELALPFGYTQGKLTTLRMKMIRELEIRLSGEQEIRLQGIRPAGNQVEGQKTENRSRKTELVN